LHTIVIIKLDYYAQQPANIIGNDDKISSDFVCA
jgi:hypothetical protein